MEEQRLTKRERRALRREQKLAEREKALKKRKSKKYIWWAVAVIGVGLIIYGIVAPGSPSDSNGGSPQNQAFDVGPEEWVKGASDARVTMIEYGDFQCPACAAFQPVVKQLASEFADDLQIVYRHFPLSSIHPLAITAGRASEAAGAQGRFWEMHDLLYERQREWTSSGDHKGDFIGYAEELGLDVESFTQFFEDSQSRSLVMDDRGTGVRLGITGTPSFFVAGEKIQNPGSIDTFRSIIQAAIAAAPAPKILDSLEIDDSQSTSTATTSMDMEQFEEDAMIEPGEEEAEGAADSGSMMQHEN